VTVQNNGFDTGHFFQQVDGARLIIIVWMGGLTPFNVPCKDRVSGILRIYFWHHWPMVQLF